MIHLSVYDFIPAMQWFFIMYFVSVNAGYLALNILALRAIYRYMQRDALEGIEAEASRMQPPVSILVPAHNEEAHIAGSIRSLLQVNYPEFEVVVVNDGSSDGTLEALKKEFALAPVPEAVQRKIATKTVRGYYISTIHPGVRVIDKEKGGKADALNAGINAARYPLFCGVDADSVLQHDSLAKVVQPFMENGLTIASGGTVRAANGCEVRSGVLVKAGLPKNLLALFQIMEYLRAYLIGRMGWSEMNALMVISGAFGIFRRDVVIEAGGYRTDTVGEDMELVVRIHLMMRRKGKPYRVTFIPDPVCWSEVPEDLRTLRNQRIRWHRGLAESLYMNRELLFARGSGAVGWIAFPFMLVFELLGTAIEVIGYFLTLFGFAMGVISLEAFLTFMFVAVGLGILLSVNSLLIEELSFKIYRRPASTLLLFFLAIVENLGYRQMNSAWRMIGLWRFISKSKQEWGAMKRRGWSDPSAGG